MLQHLDLFSGIGGFALACQWAGIETIGFVEIDKYCQKVLRKHWPGVPIVEDIRDVARIKEIVANTQANGRTGCRTTWDRWAGLADSGQNADTGYCGNGNQPTTLITAGFPCQPFSVAGKQLSQGDDRYLWPQTIAVIKEVSPKWVLLENVTGIINLAIDTVLSDLEGAGYSWEALVIPACAVNAPHRRDRVWVVAHTIWGRKEPWPEWRAFDQPSQADVAHPRQHDWPNLEVTGDNGQAGGNHSEGQGRGIEPTRPSSSQGGDQDVADSNWQGLEGSKEARDIRGEGQRRKEQPARFNRISEWWAVEPELGRVAHGIPHRVDRLKCLGNAIVPQVAYEIIKAIVEIDERIPHLDYIV